MTCRECHAETHKDWCSTQGKEHTDPKKWCRAPRCKDTNWGGYNRLHYRDSTCPSYSANPEPNHMAEFWEAIRESVRQSR